MSVPTKPRYGPGRSGAGPGGGIMAGIAKQFSNAELKEMAKYVSALPGELKTVPQDKFR